MKNLAKVNNIHVGDIYKVKQLEIPRLYTDEEEFLIMLVVDKWSVNGTALRYRWLNLTTASLLRETYPSKEQAEYWLKTMCDCWTLEKLAVDEIHILTRQEEDNG